MNAILPGARHPLALVALAGALGACGTQLSEEDVCRLRYAQVQVIRAHNGTNPRVATHAAFCEIYCVLAAAGETSSRPDESVRCMCAWPRPGSVVVGVSGEDVDDLPPASPHLPPPARPTRTAPPTPPVPPTPPARPDPDDLGAGDE